MSWIRKLRALGRLMVDYEIFKSTLEDVLGDDHVRRSVDVFLTSEPTISAAFATLSALWKPLERDLRDLR